MMEGEKPPRYVVPTKQIKTVMDMPKWDKSQAYQEYLGFIQTVGSAINGRRITDEKLDKSEAVMKMVAILDVLSSWVDEIKLAEQQQRFGNVAFREWHSRLIEKADELLADLIADKEALAEIKVYLLESFGNSTRIDYGTGHEMAFVMFLACLFNAKVFDVHTDTPAVGLTVFAAYMTLARKLQMTYRMEPAGSQGVWSLDDYQFVSFIWGAAQFVSDECVSPNAICDYEKANELKKDYHFFACIDYINQVKTGPFAEHSNQLWNVSAVPSWTKVYAGLIKMYTAEILSKFPVIQHTFFGSIFRLDPAQSCANAAGGGGSGGRMLGPGPRPKFNPANMPPPPSLSRPKV